MQSYFFAKIYFSEFIRNKGCFLQNNFEHRKERKAFVNVSRGYLNAK